MDGPIRILFCNPSCQNLNSILLFLLCRYVRSLYPSLIISRLAGSVLFMFIRHRHTQRRRRRRRCLFSYMRPSTPPHHHVTLSRHRIPPAERRNPVHQSPQIPLREQPKGPARSSKLSQIRRRRRIPLRGTHDARRGLRFLFRSSSSSSTNGGGHLVMSLSRDKKERIIIMRCRWIRYADLRVW